MNEEMIKSMYKKKQEEMKEKGPSFPLQGVHEDNETYELRLKNYKKKVA